MKTTKLLIVEAITGIAGEGALGLEKDVNYYLERGWTLHGNMIHYNIPDTRCGKLLQALVKEEDSDENK